MKLTDRQRAAMARITKDGGISGYVLPAVAKQLEAKGLVVITGEKHQRYEWGEPVKGSTLWEVMAKPQS